jgi:DNA-3-methyladenine glycosylase II
MTTFSIRPDAPFSLSAAAGFGFGPHTGRSKLAGSQMRLAFVTDDMAHHAAAHVTQDGDGTVTGEVETDGDPEAVWRQVLRILSLDHSGAPWAEVGARDPVIGRLQGQYPGLRPVLFHSPYEAAAWTIISARRYRSTAALIRDQICDELGQVRTVAGEQVRAFPLPERLLSAQALPNLAPPKVARLHAVARAALDGSLDAARLATSDPDKALAALLELPGIGPAYATLILLRSTGVTDLLTFTEPRLPEYVGHFYGIGPLPASREQLVDISAKWEPFRTWSAVLLRVAGDRQGLLAAA